MTTGTEAIAQTECADLRQRIAILTAELNVSQARIVQLGAQLSARTEDCKRLAVALEKITAECAELRAGIVAPPY